MKALFQSLILGCAAFALSAQGAAEFKFGYVDLQKTLESTEAGKAALASLKKEMASKKTQLEKQQADLQSEAEQFEKKAAIMNDAAKAQKQGELQKKYADLQKALAESQMGLQKKERELTEPLVEEIRSLIAAMAKEKSINLVLEEKGGGILYADAGTELTEGVIERFNAKNKGKTVGKKK